MVAVDFGVFLSAERLGYRDILDEALLVEDLGYHSVWISDHVYGMYEKPEDNRFECWTTTSALAANTSTVRLGQLVMCNPFRHPSLMAKMAATLDSISGGRLEVGLGTGWNEGEFKAYGYPFESPAARVRRLDEAAQIMKRMWTEESPSFKGKFYEIDGAYCSPKPVQRPHPPLMLAGGGEKLTLRTVARHADVCNFAAWRGTPEDYRHKTEVLERHCKAVGRDPAEIRKSWACFALIAEDEDDAETSVKRYERARGGRPPIFGTPEQCIEQIRSYAEVGVTLFITRFMGGAFEKEAKLFAEEVLPAFRETSDIQRTGRAQ